MGCVPPVGLHHLHTGGEDKPSLVPRPRGRREKCPGYEARTNQDLKYFVSTVFLAHPIGSKMAVKILQGCLIPRLSKLIPPPQPCHEITSAHLTLVAMATCVSACSAAKCVPFDLGVSPRAEDRGYTRRKKGRKKVCFHVIRGFQYQLIFT